MLSNRLYFTCSFLGPTDLTYDENLWGGARTRFFFILIFPQLLNFQNLMISLCLS